MAREFVVKHGLISPGSAQISGSLTVLGGISGSLFGTASWANNSIDSNTAVSASWASQSFSSSFSLNISPGASASFALSSDSASFAAYAASTNTAITTSWSNNSTSASYALHAWSSSYAESASYEINYETSSSYAETASVALYSLATDTNITTSWANNSVSSSWADQSKTASFALNFNPAATASYANFATSASWAPTPTLVDSSSWSDATLSASHALRTDNADSASFATYASTTNLNVTVSYANFADSASWAPTPTLVDSSSWADTSLSASHAIRADNADSSSFASYAAATNLNVTVSYASFAESASWAPMPQVSDSSSWASSSISSSWADTALSSSHALRSDNADSASFATYASSTNLNVTVSYANFADSASWAPTPTLVDSSSWADVSLSASHALVSDNADTASFASYAAATNLNVTVSYADFATSASWAPMPQVSDSASWASSSISSSWSDATLSASHALRADNADSASASSYSVSSSWSDTASLAMQTMVYTENANVYRQITFARGTGPQDVLYDTTQGLTYNPNKMILSASAIRATEITASLLGTSSWAENAISSSAAVWSLTASFAQNLNPSATASYASFAKSSSYADFAKSASWSGNTLSASYAISTSYSDYAVSASYEINYELSSSYAETASVALTSISSSFADFASSASFADFAKSSSYGDFASSSSYGDFASSSSHADFATSASWAPTTTSETASYLMPGASIFLSQSYIYSVTGSTQPSYSAATIWWDDTAKTYAIYTDHPGVSLQIGQEQWIRAYAGEYIPNGSAVYVYGAVNTLPAVKLALADGGGIKYAVIGIATENIASGSIGLITSQGQVHDLDTSMYSNGSGLFLSNTTSGSYQVYPPVDPYEKVVLGYVLYANSGSGVIQVNIVGLPQFTYPFVGVTQLPSISTGSLNEIYIGTGSVNFSTTADGSGRARNYQLQSASFAFTASSITDAQYVIATYNSGSPIIQLISDRNIIDGIQNTILYTVTQRITGSNLSYVGWDTSGNVLANKLLLREETVDGIERDSGLDLGVSASFNVTLTSGSVWNGVNHALLPAINTGTTNNQLILLAHSASQWSASYVSGLTNTQCDDGTNVVALGTGGNHWVVNYIYRGIGNNNYVMVMYSQDFSSPAGQTSGLTLAQQAQPPAPPTEFDAMTILVGRVIYQKNVATPVQIDSAWQKAFTPAGVSVHNDLTGLQGGTTGEYYHLSLTEYTGSNNGTGSFVRQTGSFMTSAVITGSITSASFATNGLSSSYAQTSSWSEQSVSSSFATNSTSASYAQTSSWSGQSVSSSFADRSISSSFAISSANADTASFATYAAATNTAITTSWSDNATSASFASRTISASFAISAANADTASFATYAAATNTAITTSWSSNAVTASFATSGLSSSYAQTSSWSGQTVTASFATSATSASYAQTASWSGQSVSSSYANFALSSSHSDFAASSSYGDFASSASWADFARSSSYADFASSSSYAQSASWAPPVPTTSASWADFAKSSSYADFASSASYAQSASWAPPVPTTSASWADFAASASYSDFAKSSSYGDFAKSASWADFSKSSSFADFAKSSSYGDFANSSSYAVTASYAMGVPMIKAGVISGSTFFGSPRTASVVFARKFPDNNYAVTVTGEVSRTWTIQSKTTSSFVINANNNTAFTTFVFWQAIRSGEYY